MGTFTVVVVTLLGTLGGAAFVDVHRHAKRSLSVNGSCTLFSYKLKKKSANNDLRGGLCEYFLTFVSSNVMLRILSLGGSSSRGLGDRREGCMIQIPVLQTVNSTPVFCTCTARTL